MNNFLKELMTLATELNEAEGFNALVVINDMELLYEKHVAELKKLPIDSVTLSLPHVEATMKKYGAIPTDWRHFFDELKDNEA
jgi:hypothetical protein